MSEPLFQTIGRKSYSKVLNGWQFAWDSTSLGTLKSCPRKYQLSILEGWRSKRGGSLHLRYGQLYHRALEVYDHHLFAGASHEDALLACLWDLRDGCIDWKECDAVDAQRTDYDEDGVATYRHAVWWNPSEHLSEEKAATNAKTVPNLFRSIVWYLERFGPNDPAKTVRLANGKPAVELSFRFDAGYEVNGEPIVICGHLDRLVDFNDDYFVLDRKTTGTTLSKYFFDQFHPDNQMSLYTVAGQIVLDKPVKGVIIDGAQIAKGFTRFERGFTMRTEGQNEEWMNDTKFWITLAGHFAASGYWPMNDKSCNDYGGCPFRGICSKDPAVRAVWLKADFVQQTWDPLEVRGEI